MPSSKRASYTIQFKMGVVEWVESTGSSLSAASRKFNVDRRMVRAWIADKERMRVALLVRGPGKRKLHEGKSPISEELDKVVFDHVLAAQRRGNRLRNSQIKQVALRCADALGLRNFKATSSWLDKWKSRCGLKPGRDGFGMELEKETVASLLHLASTLLSHVRPGDSVDLSGKQQSLMSCDRSHDASLMSCDRSYDTSASENNAFCNDYTTPEHNYCKLPSNRTDCHVTSEDKSHVPKTCNSQLQSHSVSTADKSKEINCHVTSETLSCDLGIALDVCIPSLECEVVEMDLPLGKEVEVCHTHDSALGVKVRTCSDTNARSTSPPFFPPLTFDDPPGQGGLLASRLLQPVFPDEPEIVYLDMQLGMLHSTH